MPGYFMITGISQRYVKCSCTSPDGCIETLGLIKHTITSKSSIKVKFAYSRKFRDEGFCNYDCIQFIWSLHSKSNLKITIHHSNKYVNYVTYF
jgi:hypothetical protein